MPFENTEQRKLAAIMFTDMVGYSAISQRNEALALELLAENQRLLRTQFPLFNGHEVKSTGDGFLVEFPSALQATQCAVEIQRAIAARNDSQPAARHFQVRIGIHVGDVVYREADMFGDGVNIAARIEPLAIGGGICLSDTVYAQVRNKLEVGLTKLGAQALKHIEVPMDVYRVLLPWDVLGRSKREPGDSERETHRPSLAKSAAVRWTCIAAAVVLAVGLGWWRSRHTSEKAGLMPNPRAGASPAVNPPAGVPDSRSIAVLPFANMSEETNNAFFADGIHEDILTTLALVRDLHVVSRTSVAQYRATTKPMRQIAQELGVAYVLEGSVRRAGNKVRVTGQLIRAGSDEHVWAKSYDRDLTDIFAIQSALATEIAGALQAAISPQEKSLIENQPTTSPAAYDLYLKGRSGLKYPTVDVTRAQAEEALAEAVKLDPNFAAAWGLLALGHVKAAFDNEDSTPERLAKAKAAIETAVRLAPGDPVVVEMQGSYYYYGYRDYVRAAEQYQRLLLLRPNSAEAYGQLAYILRRQARWAESLANLRRALELDPRNVKTLTGTGELLLALHRYDEAMTEYRRAAEISSADYFFNAFIPNPAWVPFHATGSTREAEQWLSNLKPLPEEETKVLHARRGWARTRGDWTQAVKIDQQHPYLDPYDQPHWVQDVDMIWDLVGDNQLAEARARAGKLFPELNTLLDRQPANAGLAGNLALLNALLGDKKAALRCAHKAVDLVPESADALTGPRYSLTLAQTQAWTGDKDGALAGLARLLHTPFGANVHLARIDPGWLPLRGDPDFEALLNNPANNAPLP